MNECGAQIDAGIEKGRQPEQWFLDKPNIEDGDEFYLRAYSVLSTNRGSNGDISWLDIVRYAEWTGLNDRERENLVQIILVMNAAWLKWKEENKPNG